MIRSIILKLFDKNFYLFMILCQIKKIKKNFSYINLKNQLASERFFG
jgi:hypothetical protein